ncbi:MAG: hypothetical protein H6830_04535 [Planctomycetes bacterium]|nr:hypothetical protein [Planctomycetota bacterium]MCB9910511.1 hypothetical protein [Planctomycetota bacterium]MCB9912637.1 hypothetical protein [Planctomycetota bacterium]
MKLWDEEHLWSEIKIAEDVRRDYMYKFDEALQSYTGPAFRRDKSEGGELLSNVYESIANALPRLAYHRPTVRVHSGVAQMNERLHWPLTRAEAIEHSMNQWTKTNAIEGMLRIAAVDYVLFQAHLLLVREPARGYIPDAVKNAVEGGVVYHPRAYVLSPHDVFFDSLAQNPEQRRFTGHGQWRDIDELIDEAGNDKAGGWNMETLTAMKKEVSGKSRQSYATNKTVRRNDAYIRYIYVPSAVADPGLEGVRGFHGATFTMIARDGESVAKFARKPMPYYGPDAGPYLIFGTYPVSGTSYSLSTTMATRSINEKTDFLAKRVWEEAKNYKRFLAFRKDSGSLAKQIKNIQTNGLLALDSDEIGKALQEITIGGIERNSMNALDTFSVLRDRLTGIDSQQRGAVAPNATATASMIANNSAEQIGSYQEKVFQEGVLKLLERAAWYFHEDSEAAIQLGSKASEIAGLDGESDFWMFPDPEGIPAEALEIAIELDSMTRGGDVQRRGALMEGAGFVQAMASNSVQFPGMANWEAMAKGALESLNLGPLAATINFNQGAKQLTPEQRDAALGGTPGADRAPGMNGSEAGTGGRFLRSGSSAQR